MDYMYKKTLRFDVQILDFNCENFSSVLLFSLTNKMLFNKYGQAHDTGLVSTTRFVNALQLL